MSKEFNSIIGGVLKESPFLKSIELLKDSQGKSRLFGDNVRKLRRDEIEQLMKQGNVSDDWAAIEVADDFTPAAVFHSSFHGPCFLGKCDGGAVTVDGSLKLPAGIYRSTIVNSEIGNGCVIHDTGVVSSCIVHDGAVLLKNGTITASDQCAFGNGVEIAVGNETGGREVLSYADLTVSVAEAVAKRRSDKNFLKEYKGFIESYLAKCTAPFGYIGKNAVVRNSGIIEDSYIGDDAAAIGATLVKNCTVLAAPDEKTVISHGACVKDTCVQWGSEITSMALVDSSVLCEHSHVERHGKVTMSILGPNTGVAEGEVTSCLLGPFVGFHHQSMLIAGIWPEGRGNVAYGANIGSNHTSRSPDQEIWCGEGLFFGLGTNIKFPSDFTGAPYSIIATGVDTLPQKLEFPFCLVNRPAAQVPGIAPSYNELFPGWVLSRNIYAVRRNEGKYRKRNRARRSQFVFSVFRPDIVDMMVSARDALKGAAPVKEIYTSGDIPGLGKNFMSEAGRTAGIEAYDLYIEYYALMQMLDRITAMQAKGEDGPLNGLYDKTTDDPQWEHARGVLASEGFSSRSVKDNLARLTEILNEISASILRSKERDDERGRKIIRDYDDVNTPAPDDSFIKETVSETADMSSRIRDIMKGL